MKFVQYNLLIFPPFSGHWVWVTCLQWIFHAVIVQYVPQTYSMFCRYECKCETGLVYLRVPSMLWIWSLVKLVRSALSLKHTVIMQCGEFQALWNWFRLLWESQAFCCNCTICAVNFKACETGSVTWELRISSPVRLARFVEELLTWSPVELARFILRVPMLWLIAVIVLGLTMSLWSTTFYIINTEPK